MKETLTRRTDLDEQTVEDELFLYDHKHDLFHRLNRTATFLWRRCDGKTTDEEMVNLLQQDLQQLVDVEVVHVGLDQLAQADLLVESKGWLAEHMTRRRMLTKLGVAAGAGLLVPVVESIVAPASVSAQPRGS